MSDKPESCDLFELTKTLRTHLKDRVGGLTSFRGTPAGLARGVIVTQTGRFYLSGSTRGPGAGLKEHPATLAIDTTERRIHRLWIEILRRNRYAWEEAIRRQRRERVRNRSQTVVALFVASKLPEHRRASWIAAESQRWPDGKLSRREVDRILEGAGFARGRRTKEGVTERHAEVFRLWHESTLPERDRAKWIESQLQLRPGGALSRRRIDQILAKGGLKTRE